MHVFDVFTLGPLGPEALWWEESHIKPWVSVVTLSVTHRDVTGSCSIQELPTPKYHIKADNT